MFQCHQLFLSFSNQSNCIHFSKVFLGLFVFLPCLQKPKQFDLNLKQIILFLLLKRELSYPSIIVPELLQLTICTFKPLKQCLNIIFCHTSTILSFYFQQFWVLVSIILPKNRLWTIVFLTKEDLSFEFTDNANFSRSFFCLFPY